MVWKVKICGSLYRRARELEGTTKSNNNYLEQECEVATEILGKMENVPKRGSREWCYIKAIVDACHVILEKC